MGISKVWRKPTAKETLNKGLGELKTEQRQLKSEQSRLQSGAEASKNLAHMLANQGDMVGAKQHAANAIRSKREAAKLDVYLRQVEQTRFNMVAARTHIGIKNSVQRTTQCLHNANKMIKGGPENTMDALAAEMEAMAEFDEQMNQNLLLDQDKLDAETELEVQRMFEDVVGEASQLVGNLPAAPLHRTPVGEQEIPSNVVIGNVTA